MATPPNAPRRQGVDDIQAEADLLLEITGQGISRWGKPGHIRMSDDPAGDKFLTVHRHPHRGDMIGHLQRLITVGGYLTWGEGHELARAVCVDGDDPRKYGVLEAAATALLSSGAHPFLETAPLPDGCDHAGGGKLWLVFDALVNWNDAFATLNRHAEALRGLEHYPPGRVRAPGGLYRRGVNVWAELQAVGAEDDNWYTGVLAIRTIMENLTPVGWVTERATARTGRRGPIVEGPIPEHHRNNTLIALAGSMRRAGFHERAILAALQVMNEDRCDPPLEEKEVAEIAHSSTRYPVGSPPQQRSRLRVRTVARHA